MPADIPDERVQPLRYSGKDESHALNPLGAKKNNVPPTSNVPIPNHNANSHSLRAGLEADSVFPRFSII